MWSRLFAKGGLFYQGKAPGSFAPPVKNQVACGQGGTACAWAIMTTTGCPRSWSSRRRCACALPEPGRRQVPEHASVLGLLRVHLQVGRNLLPDDGHQQRRPADIFVTYGAGLAPQIFFNRGFRCFGLARKLDTQLQGLLPWRPKGSRPAAWPTSRPHGDGYVPGAEQRRAVLLPMKVEGTALAAVATLPPAAPAPGRWW